MAHHLPPAAFSRTYRKTPPLRSAFDRWAYPLLQTLAVDAPDPGRFVEVVHGSAPQELFHHVLRNTSFSPNYHELALNTAPAVQTDPYSIWVEQFRLQGHLEMVWPDAGVSVNKEWIRDVKDPKVRMLVVEVDVDEALGRSLSVSTAPTPFDLFTIPDQRLRGLPQTRLLDLYHSGPSECQSVKSTLRQSISSRIPYIPLDFPLTIRSNVVGTITQKPLEETDVLVDTAGGDYAYNIEQRPSPLPFKILEDRIIKLKKSSYIKKALIPPFESTGSDAQLTQEKVTTMDFYSADFDAVVPVRKWVESRDYAQNSTLQYIKVKKFWVLLYPNVARRDLFGIAQPQLPYIIVNNMYSEVLSSQRLRHNLGVDYRYLDGYLDAREARKRPPKRDRQSLLGRALRH